MSNDTKTEINKGLMEISSFYVNNLLVGVDIQYMQEINRHLDITEVPHSPEYVKGVVNLRGEVVTVLDLRTILGMDIVPIDDQSRNVIINYDNENVGLVIDKIADVVIAKQSDIEPAPANVGGVQGYFFQGVYKLENELLVILDVNKVLQVESEVQVQS